MTVRIIMGDCIEKMRELPDASMDSVVTDPPYGLEFMGQDWDGADGFRRSLNAADAGRDNVFGGQSKRGPEYRAGPLFQEWSEAWAREALRILKPGGHMLAFGGTRTYHRLACAIEDAGFEIRDCIRSLNGDEVYLAWVYGSGFPKSLNVEKALDGRCEEEIEAGIPQSPESVAWRGWGTALKPAWEPIVVARKPLIGTVAENALTHGTGAMNIDGCRIETTDALRVGAGNIPCRHDEATPRGRDGEASSTRRYTSSGGTNFAAKPGPRGGDPAGRWPANLIHDGSDEVLANFPDAPGQQCAVGPEHGPKPSVNAFGDFGPRSHFGPRGDRGSAARFFYCAKATTNERGEGNTHPTVKPLALMRYLLRLVTPPGGTALDPFAGSGTTGLAAQQEGFDAVLIEQNPTHVEIIRRRLRADAPLLNSEALA